MATVYSNALNLFNLTVKSTPIGADLVPIGDSAVTGVPLKQATISSILAIAGLGNVVNVTASTQAMAVDTTYYVNYTGGACTLTVPTAVTSAQGSWVQIRGGEANTAPFVLALNASQQFRNFATLGTATTGTITVPGNFDSIRLECDSLSGGLIYTVVNSQTSGSIAIT